jgi:hypothetical protein
MWKSIGSGAATTARRVITLNSCEVRVELTAGILPTVLQSKCENRLRGSPPRIWPSAFPNYPDLDASPSYSVAPVTGEVNEHRQVCQMSRRDLRGGGQMKHDTTMTVLVI